MAAAHREKQLAPCLSRQAGTGLTVLLEATVVSLFGGHGLLVVIFYDLGPLPSPLHQDPVLSLSQVSASHNHGRQTVVFNGA